MPISIRAADSDEDGDILLELQRKTLPDDEPVSVTDDTIMWWLAWDGDIPVGFAAMRPSQSLINSGYLTRSGVLQAYRGHGLQKKMIRVRARYARRLGWGLLVSDATNDNPASINSLVSCGFKAYMPLKPWGRSNSVYFIKELM